VVDINSLFIIFFINYPLERRFEKKKNDKRMLRRRFKSQSCISNTIGGVVWYTNTKDGRYTPVTSTSKVDGNRRSITSANDHQKVALPAIYQTGMLLVSTKEPIYRT
jgi:hypothetical protein